LLPFFLSAFINLLNRHNVQPLVSGVAHACYKKYSSQAAAIDAFKEALAAGTVVVV
jgi:hypothetical protein